MLYCAQNGRVSMSLAKSNETIT
uniref:Uncharacterized protein n=1 Tax=Anopheles atroparvus TaxID=41427 RepID=A0AAG5DSJ0_ANOAO